MPGTTGHSYEDNLRKMNGQSFSNPPMGSLSMRSPGDQQLAQRQVENAKIGLTHVIGLGSACGIHILEKV